MKSKTNFFDQLRNYNKRIKTQAKAKSQARRRAEAEAEMMYEMRAAFGPGETVVNVLTGKRYHT